jgi:hypothetical protein
MSNLIFIDPVSVTEHCQTSYQITGPIRDSIVNNRLLPSKLSKSLGWRILNLEPFIKPWFGYETLALSKVDKYKNVEELIALEGNYKESSWYLSLRQTLIDFGVVRHKGIVINNFIELDSLFETYLLPLIQSIKINGFLIKNQQIPEVIVGNDLRLLKASRANHRFFIARKLGINRIPVKISGVHIGAMHGKNSIRIKSKLNEVFAKVKERYEVI